MAGKLGLNESNEADMIRFEVLPDDVLLDIFDFYIHYKEEVEAWQTLVHVCRRWRTLVFISPRRLNLRLVCTPKTRIRDKLDLWPPSPLIDLIVRYGEIHFTEGADNIVAALEQSNRVCRVTLEDLANWQSEQVLAAMQVPFPELTDLRLQSFKTPTVIPDSFLGESAPRLRYIYFHGISFQGLPNLLLSATHLVELSLIYIPPSGYISPEAIVTSLSALSSLQILRLKFKFKSPRFRPDWETRRRPSPERSILPALERFRLEGVPEYIEDLVTLIDTPQLNSLEITFLNEPDFGLQRLTQFINRTSKLSEHNEAYLELDIYDTRVLLGTLKLIIPGGMSDRQLSSAAQICNFFMEPLSTVEDLYINQDLMGIDWKNNSTENALWLRLLLPFTAVRNLYLYGEIAPGIAAALQELVGGKITEVLPGLRNIFVEWLEPHAEYENNFTQFVVARQGSGYPVAITDWDRSFESDISDEHSDSDMSDDDSDMESI